MIQFGFSKLAEINEIEMKFRQIIKTHSHSYDLPINKIFWKN